MVCDVHISLGARLLPFYDTLRRYVQALGYVPFVHLYTGADTDSPRAGRIHSARPRRGVFTLYRPGAAPPPRACPLLESAVLERKAASAAPSLLDVPSLDSALVGVE